MTITANHIVAIDPGGTTGLAYWSRDRGSIFALEAYEETRRNQMLAKMHCWSQQFGKDILFVCESYVITSRTAKLSQQYDPLKIIGVLEYFEYMYGSRCVLQKPSDAKRFSTDARLKASGMWQPTKGGHANDAARHLFMYLVKHGEINIGEVDARRT